MPFLVTPKTSRKMREALDEVFGLQLAPNAVRKEIWHANFRENLFLSEVAGQTVFIMLTGYGNATLGLAILREYNRNLKPLDPQPELYYLGSCFATAQSSLWPGDLVVARYAYSDESFEQSIYETCRQNGLLPCLHPSKDLFIAVKQAANRLGIDLFEANIYCRMTPPVEKGIMPDKLLSSWWDKFALYWRKEHKYDAGEYECAAFYAVSGFIQCPAIALLNVKDKKDEKGKYHLALPEKDIIAHRQLAQLVCEAIKIRAGIL